MTSVQFLNLYLINSKIMTSYNCIIIDDDEIDRLTVMAYTKKFEQLKVIGVFDSAEAAYPFMEANQIDVLFLDIDMPKDSGLDVRKKMSHIPACIFITAHPEHAVDSFELDTLDFIVKPLNTERFTKAIQRLDAFMELKHKAALFESHLGTDAIYLKEGHTQTKVNLYDVLYLEALKDYTLIITAHKRHCVLSSIGLLLKEPHFKTFARIHRSYAVQKIAIKKITTHEVELLNSTFIPIGRSYKDNLQMLL
jgi:two-component system, LytTR family, response regulator